MSNLLWTILGVAVGILGALLLLRIRQSRNDALDEADYPPAAAAMPRSGQPSPARPAAPVTGLKAAMARRFHGITLKPGPKACDAVQAFAGKRFLPQEAPQTPVPGCDQATCQCGYAHHSDRRDEEDRRTGWGSFGGFTPSIPEGNRREKRPDRRRKRASRPDGQR